VKIKPFWADRSGAVASEFVMLTGALIMGVSVTLTTLTSSLGVYGEGVSRDISIAVCPQLDSPQIANTGSLSKVTCR